MYNFLYLNQGDGTFIRDQRGMLNVHADTSAGAAHADYDRDGDLDIFVANWGGRDQINRLYENTQSSGNWISIRLQATNSNHYAIGTKVIAHLSTDTSKLKLHRWMYPVTGYASQNDYELHFGLGDFNKIDSLEVFWPRNHREVYYELSVNQHLKAIEYSDLQVIN